MSQSITYSYFSPSFHPLIHQSSFHPLATFLSPLLSSHRSANYWCTVIFIHHFILLSINQTLTYSVTSSSIFQSSHPSAKHRSTHSHLHPSLYSLIHQPVIHSLNTPSSIFPSSHPPANHKPLTTSLSILPSFHPLANPAPTHYIFTRSPIFYPSASHSFTHYTFINPSILSSIHQPLTQSFTSSYNLLFFPPLIN